MAVSIRHEVVPYSNADRPAGNDGAVDPVRGTVDYCVRGVVVGYGQTELCSAEATLTGQVISIARMADGGIAYEFGISITEPAPVPVPAGFTLPYPNPVNQDQVKANSDARRAAAKSTRQPLGTDDRDRYNTDQARSNPDADSRMPDANAAEAQRQIDAQARTDKR